MNTELWDDIRNCLSSRLQQHCSVQNIAPVSGGDINNTYALTTNAGCFFVKISRNNIENILVAEQQGLQSLDFYKTLRVPRVVGLGNHASRQYLILEYISLTGPCDDAQLGSRLARLHHSSSRVGGAPRQPPETTPFGYLTDNFIGESLQQNTPHRSWCDFWLNQRILTQLGLASQNGYLEIAKQQEVAMQASQSILVHHKPAASLVHGDLWGGNKGFAERGEPVIFDPAVYYGDREVDLAMSRLFGGFSAAFYDAYEKEWGLPPGHSDRQVLYNLYHLLNHLNLFGGAYLASCLSAIQSLNKLAAQYR